MEEGFEVVFLGAVVAATLISYGYSVPGAFYGAVPPRMVPTAAGRGADPTGIPSQPGGSRL